MGNVTCGFVLDSSDPASCILYLVSRLFSWHPASSVRAGLRCALSVDDFQVFRLAAEDRVGDAQKAVRSVGELDVDIALLAV